MRDYFTVEEFRAFVGEKAGGKFSITEINAAQAEVIDALEAWAASAWPNVTARGTGDMAQGDATLTLAGGVFSSDDVGQTVRVVGAGTAGADLVTTVASMTDPTHVELADVAVTAVNDESVYLDGDGTAAQVRSRTVIIESGASILFTPDIPILSIDTFEFVAVGGTTTVLDPADYLVSDSGGSIRVVPLRRGAGAYTITYTYGYATCPQVIKRPAMQATSALLKEATPSKVPANTAQMTTEGTTFVFGQPGTAFSAPWPWDAEASEAVRSYWGRQRPRRAGVA